MTSMTLRVEFDSWRGSSIVANDSCLPQGRERIERSQASKTWGSFTFKSPICLMSFPDRADEAQTKIPIHSLPARLGGKSERRVSKVYAKRVVSNWVAQCNREEMQNILVTVKLQCIHCDEKSGMRRPHWCAKSAKDARLQKKVKAAVAQ